ncbi:DNA polymerase-3 subunit epsilon [Loktanella ponticola]|uniref:DNA-directed DNA polymerase n=1 Tax=Yoonia ponticola TaxID=1524255 RepID=A0A7W9BKC0_9RHOB|nr:3'-5' exonuclease [Yoonia ponticola]MBB5721664.1 DNA polymerase-3 subunit epsilon [Yoonia ponticola]
MTHLSLRIRVFLVFCLFGLGSLAVILVALWFGSRQLTHADDWAALMTVGIVAGFGMLGVTTAIWLLFDDHVSKPVEAIAANLRVRAHTDCGAPLDAKAAKYLGDLAPAVTALQAAMDERSGVEDDPKIKQLAQQSERLIAILTDIPVATILVSAEHQIVLYDGQAAAMMERVGTAKLKTSVFNYLKEAPILKALAQMAEAQENRLEIKVKAHCGDVYSGRIRTFGAGQGYTLMLEPRALLSEARPLTYDFDLLTPTASSELSATRLRDLVFVVFDTETTGLDPARDAVVQLGAVRIVNGKVVAGEVFESLVNPGVLIPARSTDVHRIDDSMVKDAPSFQPVCTQFHSFAKDAVLVAHNAPFDMAFLTKEAEAAGLVFDNPVVDTVLLSAAVFGGSAVHTLDAICDRLNITIPDAARHTALGDAKATAAALIAMIQALEGRGIATYGALLDETGKHLRILKGGS